MSAQTKSKTEQNKAVTEEQTNSGVEASRKLFLASSFKDVAKLFADFTGEEIRNKLENNDYIYITGGNTFFLLQELKKTGADKIIIEQIEKGKTYIGESAGSIIMSPNIEYVKDMDDCRKAPELSDLSALHVVDFYPLPHHTNFPFKKAVEKIIAGYGEQLTLYPISNSQAITVKGAEVRVVGK